jgi:hypothetical protein
VARKLREVKNRKVCAGTKTRANTKYSLSQFEDRLKQHAGRDLQSTANCHGLQRLAKRGGGEHTDYTGSRSLFCQNI